MRPFSSKILNRSGQSLISVIVAGGLGAIVFGFLTDMMIKQGVGQKFLSQKMEISDLTNNLITTFSKASNCSCQFENNAATNPNFSNIAALKFDSTQPAGSQKINVKKIFAGCKNGTFDPPLLAEEGANVPTSQTNLKVDKINLINLQRVGGPNDWQGQWEVTFQVGTNAVLRSVKPITVTQKITIDATVPTEATVDGCSGISTGSGTNDFLAKWSLTMGLLQDSGIYESSSTGNVGIRTTTPSAPLHIKGSSIRVDRSTMTVGSGPAVEFYNNAIPVGEIVPVLDGADGSALNFYTKTSGGNLGSPKMQIDNSGNIGVGVAPSNVKLDVAGAIRPGSSATVTNCGLTAANGEGSQRYNYTNHRLEYCNGTSWVSAQGGGIDWKNPDFTTTRSSFSNIGVDLGSTYTLCLVVGTGTNNGGCYMLHPGQSSNPQPGKWYLSIEAYGLNTNCIANCWN